MNPLIDGPILFVLVPLSLACAAFVAYGFAYVHVALAVRWVRRRLAAPGPRATHDPVSSPAACRPAHATQAFRQSPAPTVAVAGACRFSPSRRRVGSGPLPALP
jgi:hypothetical protein